ncbi:hypothetical protein BU23DRAFT_560463 [Bimuria novae-zelandiae CBS 107.79]|uniref:Pru domain-containing protein n=1 Tax=Bimuria novae-zelandiae CBS 107.79 TaxID=1447943 RepID=A0A6A5UTA5_9PLEO|nr:hypothetical protein BU23DRAFT_560463 [Bimuria novae-zelandiae CBS 107.79]
MSIQPLITFKAGQCELSGSAPNHKVKPKPTPGYVYLYQGEDEFVHFCWRARESALDNSELDLIMIPGDGSFIPYTGTEAAAESENVRSPTDGRIFVLKFSSSSQRYLFWLQAKSQHPRGDASWFSPRDLAIGQIVDRLLNGEEVDVQTELAVAASQNPDEDETMEDADDKPASRNRHSSTGGAGAGATGGDIREEGEEAREGGADGGRAAATGSTDASAIVQNFLQSLKSGGGSSSGSSGSDDPFTTLLDLLSPPNTVPVIEKAPDEFIDALCAQLPTTLFLIEAEVDDVADIDPESDTAQAVLLSLSQEDKREVLKRVVTSPQMRQSLGSLTVALRDGGLPNVSQALKIDVQNGGFARGGGMPLGGGEAVKAFVEGVKKTVENEEDDDKTKMDTS